MSFPRIRYSGAMVYGRKVRDLDTGKFYTNWKVWKLAMKKKVAYAKPAARKIRLETLRRALIRQQEPYISKIMSENRKSTPNKRCLAITRRSIIASYSDPDTREKMHAVSMDRFSTQKIEIEGEEFTFVKSRDMKNGVLKLVHRKIERICSENTGVECLNEE